VATARENGGGSAVVVSEVWCDGQQLLFDIADDALYRSVLFPRPHQHPHQQHSRPESVPAAGTGKEKVVIEYSSPNIAKPFHAGHLRSTIIGGYLARLHVARGFDVISLNYLGDWGKQFGLLVAAHFEQIFGFPDFVRSAPCPPP
jgi:hypothetical protein